VQGESATRRLPARLQALPAMAVAMVILTLDVLSPQRGCIAVLYTAVVLMVAQSQARRLVVDTEALCALLAMIWHGTSRQLPR
jgi:hypothetical protein